MSTPSSTGNGTPGKTDFDTLKSDMKALRTTVAESQDAQVIEGATSALAKGTEAFAAQRMNRGIQQALAGKKLEEV